MRRLYLSQTDKKIFGVCGGIGETYDIDPTLIRLGLVFLCLATAILPVVVTYNSLGHNPQKTRQLSPVSLHRNL